jgi:hypothetical protein
VRNRVPPESASRITLNGAVRVVYPADDLELRLRRLILESRQVCERLRSRRECVRAERAARAGAPLTAPVERQTAPRESSPSRGDA